MISLSDRVAHWPERWLEQGRREGLERGRRDGLERERALLRQLVMGPQPGDDAELPPTATAQETRMSLLDRVAQWPEEWLEQGRREGVEQGRREGLEQERALLRHLAAVRFGSGVAQRIAPSLARGRAGNKGGTAASAP